MTESRCAAAASKLALRPNGNNVKDWMIRSQRTTMFEVQRLDVSGWTGSSIPPLKV